MQEISEDRHYPSLYDDEDEEVNEDVKDSIDIELDQTLDDSPPVDCISLDISESESDENSHAIVPNTNNPTLSFTETLRTWAIVNQCTHKSIRELLHILHPKHEELPLDPRTLLGITSVKNIVKLEEDSEYCYVGIRQSLISLIAYDEHFNNSQTIALQFNIDGLPLAKSTSKQLWPILGRVSGIHSSKNPFVVALYCGNTKPEINMYLADFVKEMEVLLHDGLIVNQKRFTVKVSAIICDAPAKAYVRQSKQFSGYEGEGIEILLFSL